MKNSTKMFLGFDVKPLTIIGYALIPLWAVFTQAVSGDWANMVNLVYPIVSLISWYFLYEVAEDYGFWTSIGLASMCGLIAVCLVVVVLVAISAVLAIVILAIIAMGFMTAN